MADPQSTRRSNLGQSAPLLLTGFDLGAFVDGIGPHHVDDWGCTALVTLLVAGGTALARGR